MTNPGDPVLVSTFVDAALYASGTGFYESGGRAGRRGGSFLTSVEVGPLFGAVVARALDAWWREAGKPAKWVVIDAGAGPGTLARTVAAAQPACAGALRFISVERSAAQRALHLVDESNESTESLTNLPLGADVILANELLDNLAFDLIEHTPQGWAEVHVLTDGRTTPDTGGTRVPTVAVAAAWVTDARARLRPGGRLVCLDYAATTAELAARPWTEWVRAFADQDRIDGPFANPGSRDITVVVPWDQLPPPTSVTTQAAWLRAHGIDELVADGAAYWEQHAAAPDLAAIKMRSRTVEVGALVDPAGLGGFWVGEWRT